MTADSSDDVRVPKGIQNDSINVSFDIRLLSNTVPLILFVLWRRMLDRTFGKANGNAVNLWLQRVKETPNKVAMIYTADGRRYTFAELNGEINKLAKFFLSLGVRPGDKVAMILENSPEFIMSWFALMKLGATAAFVNINLRDNALRHVVKLAGPRVVVTQSHLAAQIMPSLESMPGIEDTKFVSFGPRVRPAGSIFVQPVETALLSPSEPPSEFKDGVSIDDTAMLIYTSGTTGLPKAAIVAHSRLLLAVRGFTASSAASPDDRVYTSLPLFHSAASMVGVGPTLAVGATLVLAPKFSATRFFEDCRTYKVTIAQYIGELCRFLLATPPSANDRNHYVHTVIGNGMRPDIWLEFKKRFGIRTVCEFYASTEGNANMFNAQTDDKFGVGAVGRLGVLLRRLQKFAIVKVDPVTEEPVRDAKGHLILCAPNEPGELIAMIRSTNPSSEFKGYHGNPEGTKKKIVASPFGQNDEWFRTGDILRYDENNYFYFSDRVGDTFRWKGENVSTTEVSEALANYQGIEQINVYGVQVPNTDGRAGMAAIVVDKGRFDMAGLAQFARKRLPSYAVPVFIRIQPQMQLTGTYKQVKYELRTQGCDPSKVTDPLFWLPPGGDAYMPFTASDYAKFGQAKAKL
ncbi:hypothetical protein HK105_202725 [Polyrhizophydium stewartii]|uniref:Uncharacterized protein n=1 Tax=Polyrhizophydium stewartii TaxID=2732419 RepID=A0ABR4NEA4_9FUNG|nr:hypothetical protein HK105_001065 [Polyrhizophydium stewartii]